MITVKFLGGARTALGRDRLQIERPDAKLYEILDTVRSLAPGNSVLSPNNLLVAVNGVESSVVGGLEATVRDGDVVSIVPVVHGG